MDYIRSMAMIKENVSKPTRENIAGVAIIFFITFLFAFPIFQGNTFSIVGKHMLIQYPWRGVVQQPPFIISSGYYQTDMADTYYPYFGFLTETLRRGEFPLWLPGVFGGQPLDLILGGVYYPPRLLLMPFFDTARQFDILLIAHLLIAGLGMFFLLRTWENNFYGALLGATIWEFSGHQSAWLLFPSPPAAVAWLPLTLLGATLAITKHSWLWAIACGIALGMVISAGDLHYSYVNGLLLTIWYGMLIFPLMKTEWLPGRKNVALGWVFYPMISAFIALVISMPAWLPLSLVLSSIHRQAYTLEAQLTGLTVVFPMWKDVIAALFLPVNYSQNVPRLPSLIFIGIPALLLVPLAFFRKSRLVILFGSAGVFSFVLLTGFRPAVAILRLILPLFSTFHLDRVWSYLLCISLTVLSSFGLGELLGYLSENFKKIKISWILGAMIILLESYALVASMRIVTPVQPETTDWLFPNTPLIRNLQTIIGEYRILPVYHNQSTWTPPVFSGNSSILFGFQSASGYQSLLPYRSILLWSTVQLGGRQATDEDLPVGTYRPYYYHDRLPLSLLEKVSVGYLVTPPGVRPKDSNGVDLVSEGQIKLVYQGPDGWIYKDEKALPRAFLVPQVEVISDSQSALARLIDPGFDARTAVILSNPLAPAEMDLLSKGAQTGGGFVGDVRIVDERPNQVNLAVNSSRAGVLVLNDTWWPGWHVYVDGTEQTILEANYNFRGVFVSAGAHQVRFIYQPAPLLISLGLSGLSMGILTVLFVILGVRKVQKLVFRYAK